MIVYHGSNSNFKKLRIAKSLIQRESTKTNEGMGIYFTTDIEVAKSYGPYVYTLEINDNYFQDFRKRAVCQRYVNTIIKQIRDKTGVNLHNYLIVTETVNRMYLGGLSISGVGREFYLLLDSNAKFYELPQYKIEKVYSMLRGFDRKPPKAYMFNYHIKDIGVLKDVSEDVVRIVKKEQRHLV